MKPSRTSSHFSIIGRLAILFSLAFSSLAAAPAQGPQNMVEVIVQARNMPGMGQAGLGLTRQMTNEFGRQLTRDFGGEVTHELGLINAVVMRVPEQALKGLLQNPNVRIFPNSRVQLLLATRTARDEFSAISYSGSNGDLSWDNEWQEVDDLYGISSGMAQVVAESYCASGNCLRLGDNNAGESFANRGVSRSVSIVGAASATLSFSYRRRGSGGSAAVTLAVSKDAGATWANLASYALNASDNKQVAQSFDLTPYMGQTTLLRFTGFGTIPEGGAYFNIDNLQVVFTGNSLTPLAPLSRNTLRDEFAAAAYTGSNGTAPWIHAWSELGEADGPAQGNMRVFSSAYCAAGYCGRIGGSNTNITGRGASRRAELTGAVTAELTFSYRKNISSSKTGNVTLAISRDGSTNWTTLATYTLNGNDVKPGDAALRYHPLYLPADNAPLPGLGNA